MLAAAQGGDEEAYARLFRDIQPVLLRYLHVIAGQAAGDESGQMWLEVVAGLDDFRGGEESWRAWLFISSRRCSPMAQLAVAGAARCCPSCARALRG